MGMKERSALRVQITEGCCESRRRPAVRRDPRAFDERRRRNSERAVETAGREGGMRGGKQEGTDGC